MHIDVAPMKGCPALGLFRGLDGHASWPRAWRAPEPKASNDLIIVGGGGHGLATACYSAKVHGLGSIAVLEKGWVGGGNSLLRCALILSLLCSLLSLEVAQASEIKVTVRTPSGAPLANAVVTAYPASGDYKPLPPIEPLMMVQQDIMFAPYVMIAPVGSSVEFPNRDKVRHHVYSFSPPHPFELKLYGREEKRAETFNKVGIIALGCNIHDRMAAYIDVVDTRFAAKTDAQGLAVIAGLPAGQVKLKTWHPQSKAPGGTVENLAQSGEDAQVTVDVRVAPPGKQAS